MKHLLNFKIFEKLSDYNEITVVNIRSVENSYSSTDKNVHFLGDPSKALKILMKILPGRIHSTDIENIEIDGKIYQVHYILIAKHFSRETIRSNGYSKEEKNEMYNKLLQNGFSDGNHDLLDDRVKRQIRDENIVREKDRLDKEYVLYKSYPKKHEVKDYVGGFDLDIFFKETLISYVERGLVFGYVGHSCRKVWVDKLLAEICLKHIKADDFACWLTSTGGRHFGNAIEAMVEEDDREGVRKYIEKYLPAIHDQAVIFNSPDHKGNLQSSIELFNKYKEMGMMMGDSYEWIPF